MYITVFLLDYFTKVFQFLSWPGYKGTDFYLFRNDPRATVHIYLLMF